MGSGESKSKDFSIRLSYIIYAPPAKVFEALTREGMIGEWCDGGGRVGDKAGDTVNLFGDWVKGEVVTFNKKALKLSYTWKPSEWSSKTPASLVTYKFIPHPAGTEVFLEHSGFASQEEADKHLNGWTDYVFEPMNDYFTREGILS